MKNKLLDYRVDDYPDKLAQMLGCLPEIIEGDVFQREISRFIPREVAERTLEKSKFNQFLITEVSSLLERVRLALEHSQGRCPRADEHADPPHGNE